jgi:hypothetical protein
MLEGQAKFPCNEEWRSKQSGPWPRNPAFKSGPKFAIVLVVPTPRIAMMGTLFGWPFRAANRSGRRRGWMRI